MLAFAENNSITEGIPATWRVRVTQTTIEGCVITVAQSAGVVSPALGMALSEFGQAIEQESAHQISPARVESLIQNVCITARLGVQDLPEPLKELYADAKQRQANAAAIGKLPLEYIVSGLIHILDEVAGIG